jgi:hypothetical protein
MRVLLLLGLLLSACNDENGSADDAGAADGCPTQKPQTGDACSLPSTINCNYDDPCFPGFPVGGNCQAGKWVISHNDLFGNMPCPAEAPSASDYCGCGAAYKTNLCSYGCAEGQLDASCDTDTHHWQISGAMTCHSPDGGT